jgi:hypothetical protein
MTESTPMTSSSSRRSLMGRECSFIRWATSTSTPRGPSSFFLSPPFRPTLTTIRSRRKAHDYTYLYGAHSKVGSLTPFIQNAFIDGIEECVLSPFPFLPNHADHAFHSVILDGEMLVWDPSLGKYMAFGTLKTFAKAETDTIGNDDARPCCTSPSTSSCSIEY